MMKQYLSDMQSQPGRQNHIVVALVECAHPSQGFFTEIQLDLLSSGCAQCIPVADLAAVAQVLKRLQHAPSAHLRPSAQTMPLEARIKKVSAASVYKSAYGV